MSSCPVFSFTFSQRLSQGSIPHDRLRQSGLSACSRHASPFMCPHDPASLQNHVRRHSPTAFSQTAHATPHQFSSTSPTITYTCINYQTPKQHSISIPPRLITATAANACGFLLVS